MHVQILGSINFDVILQVETLPRPGETILTSGSAVGRGGKGANQAVAAARFGAAVTLHAAVGDDAAGHQLLDGLAREGVDVSAVVRRSAEATGRAFVMVSASGENMILVESGANAHAMFQARARDEPTVFLTQLETSVDAALSMFRQARPGELRILNAAPALESGRSLFEVSDLIIVNEGELAFYGKIKTPSAQDGERDDGLPALIAAARALLRRDDQRVLITRGADGAVIVSLETTATIAGCAARVVDTTGAGDCFAGVLAARLAAGDALTAAAKIANRAAAISVQSLGADSAPRPSDLPPV